MDLSKCDFWRARNGAEFIIGSVGRPLLYSSDGTKFLELKCRGYGGSLVKYSIKFDNPHDGSTDELFIDDDELSFNKKQFFRVLAHTIADSSYVPILEVREGEMLFVLNQASKKTYFYVSNDKYHYSYESARFFMGPKEGMRRVQVTNFDRYRDGGSTRITTPDGILWAPIHQTVTWNGEKLKKLKVQNYKIEETAELAVIR